MLVEMLVDWFDEANVNLVSQNARWVGGLPVRVSMMGQAWAETCSTAESFRFIDVAYGTLNRKKI